MPEPVADLCLSCPRATSQSANAGASSSMAKKSNGIGSRAARSCATISRTTGRPYTSGIDHST
jgi:hypothetical protein